jgi:hypothetical protein
MERKRRPADRTWARQGALTNLPTGVEIGSVSETGDHTSGRQAAES